MVTVSDKEKWIERFARAGIISKGIVYCLIGLLTAMAAVGLSGRKMDKSDAFKFIYDQPFGKVLLIIIGIGFFGYVTWRLFQAIRDTEHDGKDAKAIVKRIGYGISGLLYLFLGAYAIKLAVKGPGSGGDGENKKFLISRLLELNAGSVILGIIALIIVFIGIRQIYKGISQKFMKDVNIVYSNKAEYFKKAGIVGYISRGLVLVIIGYFFLRASMNKNAGEVEGTKGAFEFLENNFGSLLMGMVALGLVGYGIFMFVKGRYQKIDLHF